MNDPGPPSPVADTLGGDPTLVLPEFDRPPVDPVPLLQRWIADAIDRCVREPLALSLATVGEHGRPSSRVVLLKAVDAGGLVFSSHYAGRKGRELAATPFAAATLYWRETLQQINVSGPVTRLTTAASDALFAERPRSAQATTAASIQSAPLSDPTALRERAAALLRADGAIARPADWGGYRLELDRIEFWHGSPDRLHRRLEYVRHDDHWAPSRLQP